MPIRFGVIGVDHRHIYHQVRLLQGVGAECVGFYTNLNPVPDGFSKRFPDIRRIADKHTLLEDESVSLIISSTIPSDRAPLGIEVMRHNKDFMVDKPGFTTLDQLSKARSVQKETGRIYSICFSERLEVRAAERAGQLVMQGAIGKVVNTIGIGPHRLNRHLRPEWFFEKEKYGGILTDIGSHQVDQFLFYTGSTQASVVSSSVGNFANPGDPGLEDFGELSLRSDRGTGYIRVDWYNPDGLDTWGDGRLTLLGTEGYIELRKYIDIAGRPGTDHLFLVNHEGTQHIDCSAIELGYGQNLVNDIQDRSETAMSQEHCFLASELALTAEAQAARLGHLASMDDQ